MRLEGIVLDATGERISGAIVQFETKQMDPWRGETSETSSALTGVTGYFSLDGLTSAPGTLRIQARSLTDESRADAYLEVSSVVPRHEEQVFRMPQPAEIRGRIAEGDGREGATLVLAVGESTWTYSLRLAADGSFVIPVAVVGDAIPVQLADGQGVTSSSTAIDLRPGQIYDLGDLDGKVERHFRATVVDDLGVPIPDAFLSVLNVEEGFLYSAPGDENGAVPLPTLPAIAGSVGIALTENESYRTIPCENLSHLDGSVFVIHAVVHLDGKVGRVGGGSAGRTEVQAWSGCENYDRYERLEALSDRSGHFTLDLIPGRVRLFARPFGALEWVAGPEIDIRPGEPAAIDWVLE
jgi:hypothetical protein